MTLKEQLLLVSDVYAACMRVSRARVSTIVLNRGATLDAVAAGRSDVTTGTYEKALRWFSANWPAGADWPEAVARPVCIDGETSPVVPSGSGLASPRPAAQGPGPDGLVSEAAE